MKTKNKPAAIAQKKAELHAEIERLQSDLQTAKDNATKAEHDSNELLSQHRSTTASKELLEKELIRSNELLGGEREKVRTIGQRNAELLVADTAQKEEILAQKDALGVKTDDLEKSRAELKTAQDTVTSFQRRVHELEAAKRDLRAENARLTTELQQKIHELKRTNSVFDHFRTEVATERTVNHAEKAATAKAYAHALEVVSTNLSKASAPSGVFAYTEMEVVFGAPQKHRGTAPGESAPAGGSGH